jgi:hypothetical protein
MYHPPPLPGRLRLVRPSSKARLIWFAHLAFPDPSKAAAHPQRSPGGVSARKGKASAADCNSLMPADFRIQTGGVHFSHILIPQAGEKCRKMGFDRLPDHPRAGHRRSVCPQASMTLTSGREMMQPGTGPDAGFDAHQRQTPGISGGGEPLLNQWSQRIGEHQGCRC